MIELHADKSDMVYRDLAMTGRYFNTGKVLIGVSYVPRARPMSWDEERIQGAFLKKPEPRITARAWGYILLVITSLGGVLVANVL
jgi:hypothetical protein